MKVIAGHDASETLAVKTLGIQPSGGYGETLKKNYPICLERDPRLKILVDFFSRGFHALAGDACYLSAHSLEKTRLRLILPTKGQL